ncbi:MAG: peroxiredoxin-like family protein [Pseudomonadota bacterium]
MKPTSSFIVAASLLLLAALTSAQAQVPTDAADVKPLLPGLTAPAFSATTASGDTFTLDPADMERPAVLIFYRGGWCPFCNLYWSKLREIEEEMAAMNQDVVFISPDRPELLAEALADEQDQPSYLLASDGDSKIAEAFGIAFRVDDETYKRMKQYEYDLEEISGFKHRQLPAPAVFIVDTDGIIKFSYVNPDYKVRLHPDVLLAAASNLSGFTLKMQR